MPTTVKIDELQGILKTKGVDYCILACYDADLKFYSQVAGKIKPLRAPGVERNEAKERRELENLLKQYQLSLPKPELTLKQCQTAVKKLLGKHLWNEAAQLLIDNVISFYNFNHKDQINDKLLIWLDKTLQAFKYEQFANNPELWAELCLWAGRVAGYHGRFEQAEQKFEQARNYGTNIQKAGAYYEWARVVEQINGYRQAEPHYLNAENCLIDKINVPLPLLVQIYADLSFVYTQMKQNNDHKSYLEKAKASLPSESTNENAKIALADYYNALAKDLDTKGDIVEARRNREKALHLAREVGQLDLIVKININLGLDSIENDALPSAKRIFLHCLDLTKKWHLIIREMECIKNLAWVSSKSNNLQESESYLLEALSIAKKTGNKPAKAEILTNLSGILAGNSPNALNYYLECIELAKEMDDEGLIEYWQENHEQFGFPPPRSPLTNRQLQAVQWIELEHSSGITLKYYQKMMKISSLEAKEDLKNLVKHKKLRLNGDYYETI